MNAIADHFHEYLRIPEGCTNRTGIPVMKRIHGIKHMCQMVGTRVKCPDCSVIVSGRMTDRDMYPV